MIFDIKLNRDDDNVREVALYMALEDFDDNSYRVRLIKDKTQLGVEARLDDIVYCEGRHFPYEQVSRNNIPSWVKNLVRYLEPRMHEVMKTGLYVRSFVDE